MKHTILLIATTCLLLTVNAQTIQEQYGYDFDLLEQSIVDGDTFLLASLEEVTVMAMPELATREDHKKFYHLKRNTLKVYHYAMIAGEMYDRINEDTGDMRRREKKKYMKMTAEQLKEEFKDDVKHLSRAQGEVLALLINRETDNNCYEVVVELKNRAVAYMLQKVAKFNGYSLKDDYVAEDNEMLEYILFMIETGQYELPERTTEVTAQR